MRPPGANPSSSCGRLNVGLRPTFPYTALCTFPLTWAFALVPTTPAFGPLPYSSYSGLRPSPLLLLLGPSALSPTPPIRAFGPLPCSSYSGLRPSPLLLLLGPSALSPSPPTRAFGPLPYSSYSGLRPSPLLLLLGPSALSPTRACGPLSYYITNIFLISTALHVWETANISFLRRQNSNFLTVR